MVSDLQPDSTRELGAVILAGGLARRMAGKDKGLIELAGKPMVSYALEALRPIVDACVINANRNSDQYRALGVPVVADQIAGHLGPLAGLSTGIDTLGTTHVIMCPCDSPFLQAELFEALYASCVESDADIAVAHDGDRLQPVFCIVHKRVKPALDDFLASGERKIDRWFDRQKVIQVPAAAFDQSFLNINTEEERVAAERTLLS